MTDWLPLRFIFTHKMCRTLIAAHTVYSLHLEHTFTLLHVLYRMAQIPRSFSHSLSCSNSKCNVHGVHVSDSQQKKREWRRLLPNWRWKKNVTIFSNYVMVFWIQYNFWTFRTSLCNEQKKSTTYDGGDGDDDDCEWKKLSVLGRAACLRVDFTKICLHRQQRRRQYCVPKQQRPVFSSFCQLSEFICFIPMNDRFCGDVVWR